MSGFQFVHIETYGRKSDLKGRSVGFVLDEAERQPGACEHVEDPGVPEIIEGLSIAGLRDLHDARAADAKTVTKTGQVKKTRSDQHTLLTVIASYPATMDDVRNNAARAAEVDAWQARTVSWLRETWGDRLVSVIRHSDEPHPHLHAYVLPDDSAMAAKMLHPGVVAKVEAKALALATEADAKVANRIGDTAYKLAMRGLQDSYFDRVGVPSGLARLGPGRRRLDRGAWQAEKAAAQSAGLAITAAELAMAQAAQMVDSAADMRRQAEARADLLAVRGSAFVAAARAAATVAKAEADMATALAEAARNVESAARVHAAAIVRDARRDAAATVRVAENRAARIRRLGGVLGNLWSGLAGVGRQIEVRADRRVKTVRMEARAAVVAARAQARASVGGELVDLRGRLASASHTLANAESAVRKAKAVTAAERVARLKAEAEREDFRGRWAVADNRLSALQQAPGRRVR